MHTSPKMSGTLEASEMIGDRLDGYGYLTASKP